MSEQLQFLQNPTATVFLTHMQKNRASHSVGLATRPIETLAITGSNFDQGGKKPKLLSLTAGQKCDSCFSCYEIRAIPIAQGNQPIAGWNRLPRCVPERNAFVVKLRTDHRTRN